MHKENGNSGSKFQEGKFPVEAATYQLRLS